VNFLQAFAGLSSERLGCASAISRVVLLSEGVAQFDNGRSLCRPKLRFHTPDNSFTEFS